MYRPQYNPNNRNHFYDGVKIEKVKRANPIQHVIGERIKLRKVSKELVGLCPFHQDKAPSLNVNPEKQVYLCRSCGAKGDVITFLMLVDHISFPEALRRLAARGGVELRPPTDAELHERDRRKAAEPEAKQLMAYRRAMLDALLDKRAQYFDKQAGCLRVILKRAADSPTARRATVIHAAYDNLITALEADITRIKSARWEDLVTPFRKSKWRPAQPDPHDDAEQCTAAVVAMLAIAQQRDGDVPNIPLEVSDQRFVSPREATRIDKLVTSAMAQMTVAHSPAGDAQ